MKKNFVTVFVAVTFLLFVSTTDLHSMDTFSCGVAQYSNEDVLVPEVDNSSSSVALGNFNELESLEILETDMILGSDSGGGDTAKNFVVIIVVVSLAVLLSVWALTELAEAQYETIYY